LYLRLTGERLSWWRQAEIWRGCADGVIGQSKVMNEERKDVMGSSKRKVV
jgi:hypothetical protein